MDNEIKVSVFCLAYNHEKYIRHTLDGFVMQKTNFKFEVLIHDDASTDSTAAIIREYAELYPDIIKPIYQEKNQYSKGIDIIFSVIYPKIQGKYIAYCEGDDFWTDSLKLQKQYDAMENNPECTICLHRVKFIKENGEPTQWWLPKDPPSNGLIKGKNKEKLLFGKTAQAFQFSCYFVKRTVFDNSISIVKKSASQWMVSERLVLLCSMIEGDIYYFEDAMSNYRMFSQGSWTVRTFFNSSPQNQIERYKHDMLFYKQFYEEFLQKKYRKYMPFTFFHCIACIAHYDPLQARELLKEYGVHFYNVIGKITIKQTLQYFAIRYFPGLYKKYISTRTKS